MWRREGDSAMRVGLWAQRTDGTRGVLGMGMPRSMGGHTGWASGVLIACLALSLTLAACGTQAPPNLPGGTYSSAQYHFKVTYPNGWKTNVSTQASATVPLILIIVIIAAIVTPTPDVFNLMLFVVPMVLLFFVGVFAGYILTLHRENRAFPWRIFLMAVGIPLFLIGLAVYIAIAKYGYKLVLHWPLLVR